MQYNHVGVHRGSRCPRQVIRRNEVSTEGESVCAGWLSTPISGSDDTGKLGPETFLRPTSSIRCCVVSQRVWTCPHSLTHRDGKTGDSLGRPSQNKAHKSYQGSVDNYRHLRRSLQILLLDVRCPHAADLQNRLDIPLATLAVLIQAPAVDLVHPCCKLLNAISRLYIRRPPASA